MMFVCYVVIVLFVVGVVVVVVMLFDGLGIGYVCIYFGVDLFVCIVFIEILWGVIL